jgi:hypothetical protein
MHPNPDNELIPPGIARDDISQQQILSPTTSLQSRYWVLKDTYQYRVL